MDAVVGTKDFTAMFVWSAQPCNAACHALCRLPQQDAFKYMVTCLMNKISHDDISACAMQLVRDVMSKGQAAGLNVIRAWATSASPYYALQTSPGNFSEPIFRGLDYALDQARQQNLKVSFLITTLAVGLLLCGTELLLWGERSCCFGKWNCCSAEAIAALGSGIAALPALGQMPADLWVMLIIIAADQAIHSIYARPPCPD